MTNEDAIKWLENLKQDIGQLRHEDLWHYEQAIDEIIATMEEQEAVEPKTGHWFKIHGGTVAQCTICGCWGQINMNFCPWCGAKMET